MFSRLTLCMLIHVHCSLSHMRQVAQIYRSKLTSLLVSQSLVIKVKTSLVIGSLMIFYSSKIIRSLKSKQNTSEITHEGLFAEKLKKLLHT